MRFRTTFAADRRTLTPKAPRDLSHVSHLVCGLSFMQQSRLTLAPSSRQGGRCHRRRHLRERNGLPARARQTITHDNGGEFAQHEVATEAIGLRVFFSDPHSLWQRGGIENANGILSWDMPPETRLSAYKDGDIDHVVWNLNSTPRKCLGYRIPIETFANLGVPLEL